MQGNSSQMKGTTDYRLSHNAPDKGISYDNDFMKCRYRNYIWQWEKKTLEKIISGFLKGKDETSVRYLDFACGTGRIISFLEKYNFDATGVDVSEAMMNEAKKKIKKSNLILSDLTKEELFSENHFDLLTSFRFFLNAQQPLREEVFHKLTSLLKQNGIFVFNVHLNRHSLFAYRVRFVDFLLGRKRPVFNTLSIGEIKSMTEKSGLEIAEIHHFAFLPIKENTHVPIWLLDFFESIFSKIPFLRNFSTYLIFVCNASKS